MDSNALKDLLATLRSQQDGNAPPERPPDPRPNPGPREEPADSLRGPGQGRRDEPSPAKRARLDELTFAQALPILSRMVTDESFVEAFAAIKARQDELELRLLDERNRLKDEGERTVQKAADQGRSVDHLRKDFKTRLEGFDRDALRRWDEHREDQQRALCDLGVPTFRASTDPHIVQRQRQVVNVLTEALCED